MEQYERMSKVIKELHEKGETNQAIAERLTNAPNSSKDISPNLISKYCRSVKKIPEDVLTLLHQVYCVNPDYIKGNSDKMFDEASLKYSLLQELVYDWQILEYEEGERFLHFRLDKNFFQYLLDIGHSEILQEEGMLSYEEEEAKIREKYNRSHEEIEEYVLLPRNRFIEIITEDKSELKYFSELIDTIQYQDYLNDDNAIYSPKHKKISL